MKDDFEDRNRRFVQAMGSDRALRELSREWFVASHRHEYSYHFSWFGRPVIQYPQDIVAMQEIIWRVKPDLIVETGIARGGSLIFYASMLELLGGSGRVLGVDIEIRPHNRKEIEAHPFGKRVTMIEGSSTDEKVIRRVRELAKCSKSVLVVLDSSHAHDHVLKELEAYCPLVTCGSYLVVFDTVIEDMPAGYFSNRPWDKGNNPATAVQEFLKSTDRFVVDQEFDRKLLITAAPGGYLKCVKV